MKTGPAAQATRSASHPDEAALEVTASREAVHRSLHGGRKLDLLGGHLGHEARARTSDRLPCEGGAGITRDVGGGQAPPHWAR
jgi:hypothetical protein